MLVIGDVGLAGWHAAEIEPSDFLPLKVSLFSGLEIA